MSSPLLRRSLLCLAVLVLSLGLTALIAGLTPGSNRTLIFGNISLGLGCLVHARYLLGWRRALLLFGLTIGLAFSMELLSVATQLATPYHYTAALGPQWGRVAVVVPLGWFFMLYGSHVLVNILVEGQPVPRTASPTRILLLAALTALVLTAWDLTMDPYMVHQAKAWVWDQGGQYLGIPFANYVSWVETAFIISVAYRLAEPSVTAGPPSSMGPWAQAFPVLVYAGVGLSDVLVGVPAATRVIAPFAMGIPVLAALARLLHPTPTPGAA